MPTPEPYRKKDGTTSYKVRFRHGRTQTSETFTGPRAKRDAETFCRDVENHGADYAVQLRVRHVTYSASPSLDEVSEQFFTWKAKRVKSERTVHDYRRDWSRHISPALGRRPIVSITADDDTAFVEGLIDAGLSPKTIAARHALLHSVVSFAMSSHGGRLIEVDPCLDVELPKRRRKPPKGFRPAEWLAMHAALRQLDQDAADVAEFLLSSGWRWSEAAALDAWGVDDDGIRCKVYMNRVLRRTSTGGHVIVEDDGKADASLRAATLDCGASEMVRGRLLRQGPGLVFRTKTGAPWTYSNFYSRAWKPAYELANLSRRPSPHWLRHTHVAWMSGSGATLPELQSRIGHASIKTTIDVYGSMITDVSTTALDAFAALRQAPPPALALLEASQAEDM